MANHKTGSQRYNDRMDKIFDRAKKEGRGLVSDSKTKGMGVSSPAMAKQKALNKKKDYGKKEYDQEQEDLLEKQLSVLKFDSKGNPKT